MAVVVPWLQPPDFIGAARSGAQIGLSEADMHQQAAEHAAELALKRDQLSAEMSHLASENQARREQQNAALELRSEVLKQQGLLGSERNQNQADALTARTELEKTRLNKPTFANTDSGLFERDPVTGAWSAVPGTAKPKTDIVPTYIPGSPEVKPQDASITSHPIYNLFHGNKLSPTTNSPAIPAQAAIPGHWYNKRVEIPPSEGSAADALKSPVAPSPIGVTKVADEGIIKQALKASNGDKESARQWLQDNGYTIPSK